MGNRKHINAKSAIINYRGLAYDEMGQYQLAEKAFEESLVFDPGFMLASFNLSIVREKFINSR